MASRWGCRCGDDCYYVTGASAISQGEPGQPMVPASMRTDTEGRAEMITGEDERVIVTGPRRIYLPLIGRQWLRTSSWPLPRCRGKSGLIS